MTVKPYKLPFTQEQFEDLLRSIEIKPDECYQIDIRPSGRQLHIFAQMSVPDPRTGGPKLAADGDLELSQSERKVYFA